MSTPPPEEHAPCLSFFTPRIHVATKPPALKRPICVARSRDLSMASATSNGADQKLVEWARIILGLRDAHHQPQDSTSAPPAFQPGDIKHNSTRSAVESFSSESSLPATDAEDLSRFPMLRKISCASTVIARFAQPSPFLTPCKRQRVSDDLHQPDFDSLSCDQDAVESAGGAEGQSLLSVSHPSLMRASTTSACSSKKHQTTA
jgi:hypothetical protein